MWNFITAFFQSVTASFMFLEKTIPPQERQQEMFDMKKEKEKVKNRQEIEDRIFRRIKNIPNVVVEDEVGFVMDLTPEESDQLVRVLRVRVEHYRASHPIISGWKRFNKKSIFTKK